MLALLPLTAWALAFVGLRRWAGHEGARDWTWCFLTASVLWGFTLVAGTELLGALGLFSRVSLAVLWALASSAGAAFLFRTRIPKRSPAPEMEGMRPPAVLAVGGILLLAAVGVTAFFAPPNSWDALTYHLPRALHWLQNRDVAHYPTHILRQLFMPPGADYGLAHLLALSGGDRLANLPQWFALVGVAVGAARIARQLGGEGLAPTASAVFALSLPMSVVQASSSQNDLVVAFWLIGFVTYLIPLAIPRQELRPLDWLLGGASLGLALAAKPTAYLYAPPFVLLFGVAFLRRHPRNARDRLWLVAAAALALAPSLPHWIRNQQLFGSPFGPPAGVLSQDVSPRAVVSSLIRNAAVHCLLPLTGWNRAIEAGVEGVHAAIGADPDDPRTTWLGSEFHVPPVPPGSEAADADETLYLLLHEGYAASPLHLALALASLFASRRAGRPAVAYALACAGGFLLFSAALKWQPWHARLHLPVFLLSAPLVGLALSKTLFARPKIAELVCALLLFIALPWLLLNSTRPLLGSASVLRAPRLEVYFAGRPDLLRPFVAAARRIPPRSCPVGLSIGPDDGEYLVHVALQAAGHPPRRLEHVDVRNASTRAREERVSPCAHWEVPGRSREFSSR